MTRTPTPSTSATASDSTSPPNTLTSVSRDRSDVRLDLLAGPGRRRRPAGRRARRSTVSSRGGAADGQLARRAASAGPTTPARPGRPCRTCRPRCRSRCRPRRRSRSVSGPLPMSCAARTGSVISPCSIMYASVMPNTKSPVAVFDLAAAERDAVEAVLGVWRMMSSGSSSPGEQERVGHAHHRQVLVRLAPAVAAARATLLAGAHEVPHVVGEHAVLDEHVALRGRAFVVDRVRAPLAARSVPSSTSVTSGDATCSPTLTPEHRRVLVDEVGLEAVAARLVEQHAAGAALAARPAACPHGAGTRVEHRRARASAAMRATSSGSISSKSSKPMRAPGRLVCRSACRCRRPRRSCTTNRVRTWSSSASRPSELATRIRRRRSA